MQTQPINAARVRQAVEAQGLDWHYQTETGSTNADALLYHSKNARDVVAFSEAQTEGRGRRGRLWMSPFARNIYCTVGVSRSIPAASQGLLSIVTGVALCRSLRQQTGLAVALKWPNDLLFEGQKLGGILIESRALTDGCYFFAIGYGLNLCMSDADLNALDRPATSLDRHLGDACDRSELLVATIVAVSRAIRAFDVSAVADLIADFSELDAYHGETVEVLSAHGNSSGINRGIDARGQLCLETAQGVELHSAAEISLRPATA